MIDEKKLVKVIRLSSSSCIQLSSTNLRFFYEKIFLEDMSEIKIQLTVLSLKYLHHWDVRKQLENDEKKREDRPKTSFFLKISLSVIVNYFII